jgi:hypothetical protein
MTQIKGSKVTELLPKTIEKPHNLPEQRQDKIAGWILEKLAAESDWDDAILTNSLGDALNPDGNLDFDQLRLRGKTVAFLPK